MGTETDCCILIRITDGNRVGVLSGKEASFLFASPVIYKQVGDNMRFFAWSQIVGYTCDKAVIFFGIIATVMSHGTTEI